MFSNDVFSRGNVTCTIDSSDQLFMPKSRNFQLNVQKQKKLEKFSKVNAQNVLLDMITSVLTTPTKISRILIKIQQKLTHNRKKILSLIKFRQNLFSHNLVPWHNCMQFCQRCWSSFPKIKKVFYAQNEKTVVSFPSNFFSSIFFWTWKLIFWQHWPLFIPKNLKCFCSIPIVFKNITVFEIRSAKSTSNT